MRTLWSAWACLVLSSSSLLFGADDVAKKVKEFELAGDNPARASALAELRQASPDAAETRWLSGEVKFGDEWVPYAKVADHGDRWSELYRYKEERAKRTDSVEDQLFLADGAKAHRLFDEERAHLNGVIAKDPQHAEARLRLGHVLVEGVWITPEQIYRANQSSSETEQALAKWQKEIAEMKANLSHRSPKRRRAAEAYFESLRDLTAIPAMERAFALGTELEQLSYAHWLSRLNSWTASTAMARLAMVSEIAAVRLKAIKELHNRRPEEYAPVLLSTMKAPIEIETELVKYGNWWFYSQRTTTETSDKQYVHQYNARFAPEFGVLHPFGVGVLTGNAEHALNGPKVGARVLSNFARENQQSADERNSQVAAWNERATHILSESLEVAGVESPKEWWVWWAHDQGYVDSEKQQIFAQYSEEWYISRRRGLRREAQVSAARMAGSHNCFATGTAVMTEFGLQPIESIQRGDRVLTQNPETSEITFKPVLRATHTREASTQTVTLGDETLTCTTAHPFWVNGQGWRMAREIEPGMQCHSLGGSVAVTAIGDSGLLDVYNLDVADFGTYFVGQSQVLTHDITIRPPTDMLLPGLAKASDTPINNQ